MKPQMKVIYPRGTNHLQYWTPEYQNWQRGLQEKRRQDEMAKMTPAERKLAEREKQKSTAQANAAEAKTKEADEQLRKTQEAKTAADEAAAAAASAARIAKGVDGRKPTREQRKHAKAEKKRALAAKEKAEAMAEAAGLPPPVIGDMAAPPVQRQKSGSGGGGVGGEEKAEEKEYDHFIDHPGMADVLKILPSCAFFSNAPVPVKVGMTDLEGLYHICHKRPLDIVGLLLYLQQNMYKFNSFSELTLEVSSLQMHFDTEGELPPPDPKRMQQKV
jgi:hypothetical protein